MPFVDVLEQTKSAAVQALAARACLANRLAKQVVGVDRARLYQQKDRALSKLIVLGAGRLEEILLSQSLVTLSLPNRRRLHVPIRCLSVDARNSVLTKTKDSLIKGG